MRRWHILKANARSETAHNLLIFDTETKPEKLPDGSERDWLWFGWLCATQRNSKGAWGKQRWERFTTVDGFWAAVSKLTRTKSRWFCFCHNTSYDLPVLDIFGAPRKHGWKLEGAVIEAPPTIITYTRAGAKLVFLDSLNWWAMPLAKLGDRLGLAKLPMPKPKAPQAEWDTYCRRDVEVILATVLQWLSFLKDNDLGGFASTLAGQAFRTFRHRFMVHDIVIDGEDATHLMARASYHGGRVTCFQAGRHKGPITGVDINSMYPSVMLANLYPTKLIGHYPSQHKSRWAKLIRKYCIIARCVVDAKAPCYPKVVNNRLEFPLGKFETVLATPEIALARERGELLSMGEIIVYEAAPIFTGFVEFMWGERQAAVARGDEVGGWLFKILGNSLYGKFGQTGLVFQTSDYITDTRSMKYHIIDADTGQTLKCRQMGGLLQVMSSDGESRDSFPAIASHVTSHARVHLWRLIEKAGLESVLYTDTDSLYLLQSGLKRLATEIDPAALGKLKVVGEYDWMRVHAPKDYELPHQRVRKGVRANAVEIAPNTFRQTQWSSLKGLVQLGDVTAPRRKQITKVLVRNATR